MTDEIVRQLIALRPQALIVAAGTVVAYIVLTLFVSRLRVTGEGYRMAGLFVGFGIQSKLHLSISWIKLVYFAATLLMANTIQRVHYLFLVTLIVMACLICLKLRSILLELLGGGFMIAGFWFCERLLEYIRQIRTDAGISAIRWALAVVLVLCAVAIFLKEITFVSGERRHFNEDGEVE